MSRRQQINKLWGRKKKNNYSAKSKWKKVAVYVIHIVSITMQMAGKKKQKNSPNGRKTLKSNSWK